MHYQDYENENDGMANGCVRDKIPYLLNKTGQVNQWLSRLLMLRGSWYNDCFSPSSRIARGGLIPKNADARAFSHTSQGRITAYAFQALSVNSITLKG